jgi:hypothetical protein
MKILNQEEVVIKRCWLAHYCMLCFKFGTTTIFRLFMILYDEGVFHVI